MAVTRAFKRTPDPLRETPPADQFCDLILNGGVASGVVYPWALLALARHYRFKNIGGNSVGAMAAAVAAAAEYGRCQGVENAFEPLRRMPLELAEEEEVKGEEGKRTKGRTRMLRLFVPHPSLQRLFALFLAVVSDDGHRGKGPGPGLKSGLAAFMRLYSVWRILFLTIGFTLGALVLISVQLGDALWGVLALAPVSLLSLGGALLLTVWIVLKSLRQDLVLLAHNNYGLCTGLGQGGSEALVQWLHRGIQLSAGRGQHDPPLTFADLWAAPRFGKAGPSPDAKGHMPEGASINLQMFASNITQSRPVRLPLSDAGVRLFYLASEWAAFFPKSVMDELERASKPYQTSSPFEPDPDRHQDPEQRALMSRLRELPSGGMPIVVAARMSLCFPLLFSCIPVYAIDHELPRLERRIGRCLLSDGGLCTNFPIHLFDSAHPRWPTFGMLLDRRLKKFAGIAAWIPWTHKEGWADNWQRGVPGAELGTEERGTLWSRLAGVATGMVLTALNWNDQLTGRQPQVRNRVIRLALREGEGQLNIGMSADCILRMAHAYGTVAGKRLVKRFAPDRRGVKPAWTDHLYVRSITELRSLHAHLRGYSRSVRGISGTVPLAAVLERATRCRALLGRSRSPSDLEGGALTPEQSQSISRAVRAVQALEMELEQCVEHFGPYVPDPGPELRMRPPI